MFNTERLLALRVDNWQVVMSEWTTSRNEYQALIDQYAMQFE